MDDLDKQFEQFTPLLDDVISRIGGLNLCPFQTAYLAAQAVARIAIGTRLVMADAHAGLKLTPQERSELMDKIVDQMRKSNAALSAMGERYGETIQ